MEKTIYEVIEQETGFNMNQIRFAERHMIGYRKASGNEPLTEQKFKKALTRIKKRMQVGLTFETCVELWWPKYLLDQQPSQVSSVGPGFLKTQLKYEGTHVNNRNTADNGHNSSNN